MTEEELKRIQDAYESGLDIEIWSCGRWEKFDAREYPYGGFSTMRKYRIVGQKYVDEAEKQIKELKEEYNKLLDVINNQDVKIADLEKENAELKSIAEFQQSSNMKRYFEIQELKKKNKDKVARWKNERRRNGRRNSK